MTRNVAAAPATGANWLLTLIFAFLAAMCLCLAASAAGPNPPGNPDMPPPPAKEEMGEEMKLEEDTVDGVNLDDPNAVIELVNRAINNASIERVIQSHKSGGNPIEMTWTEFKESGLGQTEAMEYAYRCELYNRAYGADMGLDPASCTAPTPERARVRIYLEARIHNADSGEYADEFVGTDGHQTVESDNSLLNMLEIRTVNVNRDTWEPIKSAPGGAPDGGMPDGDNGNGAFGNPNGGMPGVGNDNSAPGAPDANGGMPAPDGNGAPGEGNRNGAPGSETQYTIYIVYWPEGQRASAVLTNDQAENIFRSGLSGDPYTMTPNQFKFFARTQLQQKLGAEDEGVTYTIIFWDGSEKLQAIWDAARPWPSIPGPGGTPGGNVPRNPDSGDNVPGAPSDPNGNNAHGNPSGAQPDNNISFQVRITINYFDGTEEVVVSSRSGNYENFYNEVSSQFASDTDVESVSVEIIG